MRDPIERARVRLYNAATKYSGEMMRADFDAMMPICDELEDAARAFAEVVDEPAGIDLIRHLHRQREFSARTFGPGDRVAGVLDHIRKELREIERDPRDLDEWIDVVLLAFDGAWRQGFSPEAIAVALEAKQARNEQREWPDWRTQDPAKAIEHVRAAEGAVTDVNLFRAALRQIADSAPDEEPEYHSWGGDTEAAEHWGCLYGRWEASLIARDALARESGNKVANEGAR
jgi:hypothetical protein